MKRRFVQLDVFTSVPFLGNPLAVVIDAEGLSTEQMQQFAQWTNLSETTFLLPPTHPEADYLVRIFTPGGELPFAGHPTLGSAFAWLQHGGTPRHPGIITQECGVGLVTVRTDGELMSFAAPPLIRSGPLEESVFAEAITALGLNRDDVVDAAWIDNGPGWLGLLLKSHKDVLAIKPQTTELKIGVAGPHEPNSSFAYEVRAFFPTGGVTIEDPVTGSLNASLAQWLIGSGRFTAPYLASQGTAIGRAGVVRITTDDSGAVWVGGHVVACIEGVVEI
jgi:PhzF family phenazine biosynthesis protein